MTYFSVGLRQVITFVLQSTSGIPFFKSTCILNSSWLIMCPPNTEVLVFEIWQPTHCCYWMKISAKSVKVCGGKSLSGRCCCIVVALLFYVHGKHLRSCRDGQLT